MATGSGSTHPPSIYCDGKWIGDGMSGHGFMWDAWADGGGGDSSLTYFLAMNNPTTITYNGQTYHFKSIVIESGEFPGLKDSQAGYQTSKPFDNNDAGALTYSVYYESEKSGTIPSEVKIKVSVSPNGYAAVSINGSTPAAEHEITVLSGTTIVLDTIPLNMLTHKRAKLITWVSSLGDRIKTRQATISAIKSCTWIAYYNVTKPTKLIVYDDRKGNFVVHDGGPAHIVRDDT